MTDAELTNRLVECLAGVLTNNLTAHGLDDPGDLHAEDLVVNLHLFERLFVAAAVVKRLKGYVTPAAWMADTFTAEELRAGLDALAERP